LIQKVAFRRLNTRSYFLFLASYLLFLLADIPYVCDFSWAADMRAISSHYQSAVGALFPFSMYVAWRPTLPVFVSHVLVGSLCGLTALAMGSRHDAIWAIAVKVIVFLFVSYASFYLSGCYFLRTSPTFPPELSIQQWLELAEGK